MLLNQSLATQLRKLVPRLCADRLAQIAVAAAAEVLQEKDDVNAAIHTELMAARKRVRELEEQVRVRDEALARWAAAYPSQVAAE